MGKAAKKVAWVGRTASMVFGLALVLALMFGVATTALAGTGIGARFDLGKTNTVNAVTKLVGSVAGPSLQLDNNSTNAAATALDLQVEPGKAPMKVNSEAKVANLNSDKLDGKSEADFYAAGSKVADSAHADQADTATNAATVDGKSANEIGINGLEYVSASSASNSNSAKGVQAVCPADKLPVTYGYRIDGGFGGTFPNLVSDVTIYEVNINRYDVIVGAIEDEPTSANWSLTVEAWCATAP